MKKLVPDPPHVFDLPQGKSLSRAISEGIVPMEFALSNYWSMGCGPCRLPGGRRMRSAWRLSVEASDFGLEVSLDSRNIE